MLLADVVEASESLAATSKRKEKTTVVAELLRRAAAEEIAVVVGLLTGTLRQGRIGVGWANLARPVNPAEQPSLTILAVDQAADALASIEGVGSQQRRVDVLNGFFGLATAAEAEFLRRVLLGDMRHGALAGVVTDAVALAFDVKAMVLRRAAMMAGDLGVVARIACDGGDLALADVGLHPGRGVLPMLASTSPTISAAIEAVGLASVEWKLDGARIQVHRVGDDVRIYTRNLNEISARLPQVAAVVRSLPVTSVVLDGEALGVADDGRPRIFQETMSRFGSDEVGAAVGLQPFFFDVLHVDGTDLVDSPLHQRLTMLERIAGEWRVPTLVTADAESAERFGAEALAAGHEGVMVKAINSPYEAGRRGSQWHKVKPVRTLDLVVLAAEWGHGRRAGWLSNLHLGARADDDNNGDDNGFVMVGKTFKGLTDELLRWQTEELPRHESHRDRWAVYLRPELVVEIAVDGVQVSRRYPGGVALRFARVKGYRPDRTAADADTIDTVRALLAGGAGDANGDATVEATFGATDE